MIGAELRRAKLAGPDLREATGYDTPGAEAQLKCANIWHLQADSDAFCNFVLSNGAVMMPDTDWLRWRAAESNAAVLRNPTAKRPGSTDCFRTPANDYGVEVSVRRHLRLSLAQCTFDRCMPIAARDRFFVLRRLQHKTSDANKAAR